MWPREFSESDKLFFNFLLQMICYILLNFRKRLFTFWRYSTFLFKMQATNIVNGWMDDFHEIVTLENRSMFPRPWHWTGFTVSWRTCALSSIFILNLVLILPTLVGLLNSPNPGKSIKYFQPDPDRFIELIKPNPGRNIKYSQPWWVYWILPNTGVFTEYSQPL